MCRTWFESVHSKDSKLATSLGCTHNAEFGTMPHQRRRPRSRLHSVSPFAFLQCDEGIDFDLAEPNLFPAKVSPGEMTEPGDINEIMDAREALTNRSKREIEKSGPASRVELVV